MNEAWKTVPSWPECEVSTLGRVKVRGKERSIKPRPDGYVMTGRAPTAVYVHRLVCEAFHGPCPEGYAAAHLNGVRHDNRPENLRWVSYAENEAHKLVHGTRAMGSRAGNAKMTEAAVIAIRAAWRMGFAKQTEMARVFGINQTQISNIVNYHTWRHVE